MKLRLDQSKVPVAVVVLAAAIAFLGYNLGSSQPANATNTASPVNIADPTHPDNLAAVSSAGALSTSEVAGTPKTPLDLSRDGTVVNTGTTELIEPTTATIDLTSLTVAVLDFDPGDSPVRVGFDILEAPTGTPPGDCAADATSDTEIQVFDLQPGTTDTLSPASPIVMAPASGDDACVILELKLHRHGRHRHVSSGVQITTALRARLAGGAAILRDRTRR
jgi:hypothetical protein